MSKATNARKGRLKIHAQDCPSPNICLNVFDTECSAVHPSETYSVQPYAHCGRVFEECGAHETPTGRKEKRLEIGMLVLINRYNFERLQTVWYWNLIQKQFIARDRKSVMNWGLDHENEEC